METVVTFITMAAAGSLGADSGLGPGETVATLLLVGAALLLLETVLPGFVAGVLGLLCLAGGVILGYSSFGARTGNFILIGVAIGFVIGTMCWVKYFPNSRVAKVFISHGAIGDLGVEKPELLNQAGVAFTNLRPSGTALINGLRVDVVSEGSMIERGTPVKVVALEGLRVVVRAV